MTTAFRCRKYGRFAGVFLAAALFYGCGSVATQRGFYDPIIADVRAENHDAAVSKLEAARQANKFTEKDRLLYYLDAGLAEHYAGHFENSNEHLHQAEQAAEELFTKSVSRVVASAFLNDNTLEYAGEDYEILYANLIKALNYLELDLFDDAFVEIRRANEKLELLEQKYADAAREFQQGIKKDTAHAGLEYKPEHVRFHNSAFARYLSMHIYAAEGLYDDARIDYDYLQEAFAAQPYVYDFPAPEVNYSPEKGVIFSVVALAGLGPRKEAFNLRLRADQDLGLIQVLYTDSEGHESEYQHLPINLGVDFYLKFAIPRMEERRSRVGRILVLADHMEIGELQLLENVATVAKETFRAQKSLIYLRSIARAISKGLAAYKLKKKVDTGGIGGWLKKVAVGVGMDLTENADLRSTQLLPGRILVGDFQIEPGVYEITVEFYADDGQLISTRNFADYQITARGLNLLEVFCPQ